MFATSLITTLQATSALGTVVDQLKADLPILLSVIVCVCALSFITSLLSSFISAKTYNTGYIGGTAFSDKKWRKIVSDNEHALARARRASRENDRIIKSL